MTLADVLAENTHNSQAFGASLVSLEGQTPAQFAAKNPGTDLVSLSRDPEFMRKVELIAAIPAVQEYALDAQLRRGLSESVTGLLAKIQAPDTSGNALCTASDALTKISNLLDRREAAKRDGGEQGLIRHLARFDTKVTIKTIEGITEFDCAGRNDDENLIDAVRAMRCTSEGDVNQVRAALLSRPRVAILNLRGF